jgi:hypothetical protein
MYEISGGGSTWQPWTTYWNGDYQNHLAEAADAAAALGAVGAPATATTTRADQLTEPFGSSLDALIAESNGTVWVNDGFRDPETQRQLWEASDKSGTWVASPGGSKHEFGMAADLGFSGGGESFAHSNADRFGLWFPMDYEPWHIEPVGSRDGSYVAAEAGSPIRKIGAGDVIGGAVDKLGLGG